MRQLMLYSLLLCLVACQPLVVKDASSPYYLPPLGSMLVLNRQITIPPNSLSVYLQYGKILSAKDVDAYQANCKFELRNFSETERQVAPDQFEITKIQRTTDIVLYRPMTVAMLGMMSDGDAPMAEIYSTTFYLHSPSQPQVLYLTCQHWDEPTTGNHLNLNQIHQALGDIMRIEVESKG